jgi:hypothetical protein
MKLKKIMLVGILVLPLAACSVAGEGGAYDFDCPTSQLVQLSIIDVSESGRDEKLIGERLDAIQQDAEFVTDCEGTLIVRAASGSAANAEPLFSGRLGASGATEIGRDRKIPAVVEETMVEIRETLNSALARATPQGNDLIAMFAIVSDATAQFVDEDVDLRAAIYTDAISTTGTAAINSPNLSRAAIQDIVAEQRPPRLDGASLSIRGVGRVGGTVQPPQDFVDLVTDYARDLCDATGADCAVFTSTNAVR